MTLLSFCIPLTANNVANGVDGPPTTSQTGNGSGSGLHQVAVLLHPGHRLGEEELLGQPGADRGLGHRCGGVGQILDEERRGRDGGIGRGVVGASDEEYLLPVRLVYRWEVIKL